MLLHLNALNAREMFFESLKKALRPGDFAFLMRRLQRQKKRARTRRIRNASYPYSSDRQNERYARQIAAGQLKFV
jgi:hypothetical protein